VLISLIIVSSYVEFKDLTNKENHIFILYLIGLLAIGLGIGINSESQKWNWFFKFLPVAGGATGFFAVGAGIPGILAAILGTVSGCHGLYENYTGKKLKTSEWAPFLFNKTNEIAILTMWATFYGNQWILNKGFLPTALKSNKIQGTIDTSVDNKKAKYKFTPTWSSSPSKFFENPCIDLKGPRVTKKNCQHLNKVEEGLNKQKVSILKSLSTVNEILEKLKDLKPLGSWIKDCSIFFFLYKDILNRALNEPQLIETDENFQNKVQEAICRLRKLVESKINVSNLDSKIE